MSEPPTPIETLVAEALQEIRTNDRPLVAYALEAADINVQLQSMRVLAVKLAEALAKVSALATAGLRREGVNDMASKLLAECGATDARKVGVIE